MANPSVALLLLNFGGLSRRRREAFLGFLEENLPKDTVILLDSDDRPSDYDLKMVKFQHDNSLGDSFRTGLMAAVNLGAERIVTFEEYSMQNATWFIPYLELENVIESRKRSFTEMITIEASNILSFGNAYNSFSMNRIFTKEAAILLKDTKLFDRSFLVESVSLLSSKGLKITEIIKPNKKKSKAINPKEALESILKSINISSVYYTVFGSVSYIINILMVYFSLSIGMFYPLALFLSSEISGLSNFVMNEKITFKNKGFLSSVYRLGKFNSLTGIPMVADIVLVGFLHSYISVIGYSMFISSSVAVSVVMSMVSLSMVNKNVWSKYNHIRIHI